MKMINRLTISLLLCILVLTLCVREASAALRARTRTLNKKERTIGLSDVLEGLLANDAEEDEEEESNLYDDDDEDEDEDDDQDNGLPVIPETITYLTNADFVEGTYRIKESGRYVLSEDIEFGPQAENNYWPLFSQWSEYPPAKYYLGFFAAIAVEADNVEIDLNGFTIRQTQEFYLVQRFFNVIELNDRVFINNNGVSSLNYQKTDRPAGINNKAQSIKTPKGVIIKNGQLGLSSHAGIHGNGVKNLHVMDVNIVDFEVAGIQCNGCVDVDITSTVVGPSSTVVPALATFSNARFLQFFTQTLIPGGFAREPDSEALLALFQDTISFADRPDTNYTLQQVFDKNDKAVELYRGLKKGSLDESTLSVEDKAILEEAKAVFDNDSGLPDGSSIYGIFINRLGTPETDENFLGAGKESKRIKISGVQIQGLALANVEVPSLMTEQGSHMQGVARDIIRIYDINTDNMRSLRHSYYKGNFLSDSYFALWKLSNTFYRKRVFDSNCGNFGSNASFPMNLQLYPSYLEPTCAQLGSKQDPTLTGRDVTMLQKQYFGGLQISQGFYDWATIPGIGMDKLLASPTKHDALRSGGRHKIVCNHDTMFHPNHGIVGIKIVETRKATVEDVTLSDFVNKGDAEIWPCTTKWRLQPSMELIQAVSQQIAPKQGSMIRGVEVVRSDKVLLNQVILRDMVSDEGSIVGIDVAGDANDRTDHEDDKGVSFRRVSIDNFSAPGSVTPFKSLASRTFVPSGITVGLPEESDASLNTPRAILHMNVNRVRAPRDPNTGALPNSFIVGPQVLDHLLASTTFNTMEKIMGFRAKVLNFFTEFYGINFLPEAYTQDLLLPILCLDRDNNPTDSIVLLTDQSITKYHASSVCVADGAGTTGSCTDPKVSMVNDFAFNLLILGRGLTLYGTFGGNEGKFAAAGGFILAGIYSFENLPIPGLNPDGDNVQIEYFAECPANFELFDAPTNTSTTWVNCNLESDLFGRGRTTGIVTFRVNEDGTEFIQYGYPAMVFDDVVLNPKPSGVKTNILDDVVPTVNFDDQYFLITADGTLPTYLAAVEAVPFTSAFHYTHEAAIKYFKAKTSLKTNKQIKALRLQFLERLATDFGIKLNPLDYNNIPLDGVIDLGGGNHIVGYTVNDDANQRAITNRTKTEGAIMPPASRLNEGGFRLMVGRAGLDSNNGRLAFGTMIMEGYYVLEGVSTATGTDEMHFYSEGPVSLNSWASSVVINRVESTNFGNGRFHALVPMPEVREDGLKMGLRGQLVFGDLF